MLFRSVQLIVYGLAPNYYEPLIRGTGIGWLVAIGRCGSVAGPLSAGLLLAAGIGVNDVLVIAVPGLVLAMIAVLIVLSFYGLHRYHMIRGYWKYRKQMPAEAPQKFEQLPRVTVQLPIYNEQYVVKRLIEETRKHAGGELTTTLLLSAPTAMTFYQGIKMPAADNCFLYRRSR